MSLNSLTNCESYKLINFCNLGNLQAAAAAAEASEKAKTALETGDAELAAGKLLFLCYYIQ